MRAAISLLVLLLSMCGVQTESHGTDASTQDVSTELKELRDMVVELKGRLVATEADNVAMKQRLVASDSKVENLEKEIKAAPKVAFSAALGESRPGHTYRYAGGFDLNLVFSRVITNVGEAYSSTTGFFTAPVRGVYYFRFTVMDILDSDYMSIRMHKNGEKVMQLAEYDTDARQTYLSSGLALQLEKGDTVNMVLPKGRKVRDSDDYSGHGYSTFSGFLLFLL